MRALPRPIHILFLLLFSLSLLITSVHLTVALDCINEEDCQNQINSQNSQLNGIQSQQSSLQSQLNSAQKNLNSTQAQLDDFQKQADSIKSQLDKATQDLNSAQASLDKSKAAFKRYVRDYFVQQEYTNWSLFFVTSSSVAQTFDSLGLRKAILHRNEIQIMQYTGNVKNLKSARDQVASANDTAQKQLAQIQAIRSAQASQIYSIQRNQSALSTQINQINSTLKNLTSQQQAIIAAKLAATAQNGSVGSSAPPSVPLGTSPFSPGFAFLTYGYPHRIGMNQYGAYGRAQAGQDFQTILRAYYGISASSASVPGNITVNGCNDYGQCFNNQSFGFEDYLKHIYEMPGSWPLEALKAQAIAARTYAMRSGSTICPSQSCQEAKFEYNTSLWQQAVDETRGLVLGGNSPISAFYSSTDGGYTCTDFYHNDPCTIYLHDVDGSGQAYDRSSPWYHKAWGTNSNAGTAWLSAEETADLFNTAKLYLAGDSTCLTPPDKGGCSHQDVINRLAGRGIVDVGSATAVAAGFDGRGNTSGMTVVGTKASYTIDGATFRSVFNARSPGTLVLWTSFYDAQRGN